MTLETVEPLARKAQADLIVERAADQLARVLKQAAVALRPFPPFPGAFFTNAVEAEPDAAGGADRGCIVVCEDGELYEFRIGMDFDSVALTGFEDPVSLRKEELQKLDLHPRDFVVYAYNAITALTVKLLEQSESES